jgi:hypothetical protein
MKTIISKNIQMNSVIIAAVIFLFSVSAQAERILLDAPKDFKIYVELDSPHVSVSLDTSKNELIKKYNKKRVVRGKKVNQKSFTVNLTENEKKVVWEYIVRNQILKIKPGDYKAGISLVSYPRIYHIFQVTKGYLTYEYKIEALSTLTINEVINKFWGLYTILELMLNSRRMSLFHEIWIIDDLRERVQIMDTGEPLPFPDDILPYPFTNILFRNILKKPERLKKFIETWDKSPICPIPISPTKSKQ